MKTLIRYALIVGIVFGLAVTQLAFADTFYVSDELEITMRTQPSLKNRILKMLESGAKLEELERNNTGYSKVRDKKGATGWVLTRFLMETAGARAQLDELKRQEVQFQDAKVELKSLRQHALAQKQQLDTLKSEKKEIQIELDNVNKVAADTLAINDENQLLTASLAQVESTQAALLSENLQLRKKKDQTWFLYGAGVIIFGIMIGLMIPKLRFKRNRKWGDYSSYD